jgi:hypothetical protein
MGERRLRGVREVFGRRSHLEEQEITCISAMRGSIQISRVGSLFSEALSKIPCLVLSEISGLVLNEIPCPVLSEIPGLVLSEIRDFTKYRTRDFIKYQTRDFTKYQTRDFTKCFRKQTSYPADLDRPSHCRNTCDFLLF